MVTQSIGYLSLGSNIGIPEDNLKSACKELSLLTSLKVLAVSRVYWTEPQGLRNQAWFANQVVKIETALHPEQLLSELQKIETMLGRKREIVWGPRIIDIDVLILGDYEVRSELLQIPHQRMCERAFVLVPLAELDSALNVLGRPVQDWLQTIQYSVQDDKIWQAES